MKEARVSLRFLFSANAFELVCGDISLKRHCKGSPEAAALHAGSQQIKHSLQ
jgi:hypothetical protein